MNLTTKGNVVTERNARIHQTPEPRVRCGIYRVIASGLGRPGLAGPDDELVLFVELTAGEPPRYLSKDNIKREWDLRAELLRGEQLRDQFRRSVQLADGEVWSEALQLHWSDRPASSRLICRIFINDQPRASCSAIVGSLQIDAQGRFVQDWSQQNASAATMLAYENELRQRLQLV